MLIENPESLKTWLTSYLEPLCDADPQALAQYVMALIGKDKPAKDLKNILFEQLEVFLQKETVPFVEVLFETLENKSYLEIVHSDSRSSTSSERSPSGCDGTLQSTADHYKVRENLGSPLPSLSPEYEPKPLINLPDSVGSNPGNQSSIAHSKRSYSNRERSKSRSHSRSRSRSRSPPISSSQNRHRPRDVDMRRPGGYAVVPNQGPSRSHFIDERNRRTGWNGPASRGMSRRYGPSSSSSSSLSSSSHLGGGYRRNQQQPTRRSRSKSRTPSRSRSRSYSPQSNRSRSRSPSHDRGRTKDKARSRPHNRVQSTSRSRSRNRDGQSAKRTRISSKSPVEEMVEEEKEEKPFIKRRCRDYNERGFCMRGDLCQYDHGSDPVVLDGAVSSVVLGIAANGAPTLAATQNITAGPANFLNEPYNPEAPGIDKQMNPHGGRRGSGVLTTPSRGPVQSMGSNYNQLSQHPFWGPIAPPLRPIPSGPNSGPFIPSLSQQNRPRELVGVPTLSDGKNSSLSSSNNSERPKIPHKSTIDTSASTTVSGSTSHTTSNTMSKRGNSSGRGGAAGSGHRGGFRGGYLKRMVTNDSADKCTLEVRKIPPNLNTIANLNSHFSKFGTIVNLQVCYDGDPEAALVQFASHSEALAAHRCTEAVLNNRFIKVFWHSKDQSQQHQHQHQQQQQQQQQSQSQPQTNQGPSHPVYGKMFFDSRERAANGSIAKDSKNSDSSRPSVKERLGLRHTNDDKNSVATNVTSSGSISRTVFNPSLLKKQYPSSSIATSTSVNQANATVNQGAPNSGPAVPVQSKEDLKKDKLLRKLDLQKKRQQILLSCMQQQKILIDKLQKAKTDAEKANIRSTVSALDKQVKKLEADIKKDAEIILEETSKLPASGKKSKIQVEKELLDVEMDFYNELHKGATTAELNAKLQELKIKTKTLCMNDLRSTKAMMKRFSEMKGALRGRNRLANHTLAKNFENLRKVDRRTRKIFIEGVTEEDNNVLLAHLSQTAEIESLESTPQGVMVTFKTRRDAEMALPLISTVKLKDQTTLKATWFDEVKTKTEESEISTDKTSEPLIKNEIEMNLAKIDEIMDQGENPADVVMSEPQADQREKPEDIVEETEAKVEEVAEAGPEPEPEAEAKAEAEEEAEAEVEAEFLDEQYDGETEEDEDVPASPEGDNEEDESQGTGDKQASPADELLLGVGVDDLLEEEETDDEDESRAWRR